MAVLRSVEPRRGGAGIALDLGDLRREAEVVECHEEALYTLNCAVRMAHFQGLVDEPAERIRQGRTDRARGFAAARLRKHWADHRGNRQIVNRTGRHSPDRARPRPSVDENIRDCDENGSPGRHSWEEIPFGFLCVKAFCPSMGGQDGTQWSARRYDRATRERAENRS